MSFVAVCSEPMTLDLNNNPVCSGTLSIIDTSTIMTTFDLSQLDPQIIALAFSAGFTLLGTAHVIGMSTAALGKFVKTI